MGTGFYISDGVQAAAGKEPAADLGTPPPVHGSDRHDETVPDVGEAPTAHALAGADHTADTLANLNLKVSDATLDDSADSRTPAAHKASHQNGGADEISVAGLSGALADAQTPSAHAASHKHGGADEVATATPAANAIPKADAAGKLDGWITGGGGQTTCVRVYRATTQSINNITWTAISFSNEDFDVGDMAEQVTNPTRVTIPSGEGGKYHFVGVVHSTEAMTAAKIKLRKNGTTDVSMGIYGGGGDLTGLVSDILDLAATDYIEIMVYHSTGSAKNIGTGSDQVYLAAHRMS
jgi:hypothetical protein